MKKPIEFNVSPQKFLGKGYMPMRTVFRLLRVANRAERLQKLERPYGYTPRPRGMLREK